MDDIDFFCNKNNNGIWCSKWPICYTNKRKTNRHISEQIPLHFQCGAQFNCRQICVINIKYSLQYDALRQYSCLREYRDQHHRLGAKSGKPKLLCYYILSPDQQRHGEQELKRGSYVDEFRRARNARILLRRASGQYREVHSTGQKRSRTSVLANIGKLRKCCLCKCVCVIIFPEWISARIVCVENISSGYNSVYRYIF